jgi:hypothetical protein
MWYGGTLPTALSVRYACLSSQRGIGLQCEHRFPRFSAHPDTADGLTFSGSVAASGRENSVAMAVRLNFASDYSAMIRSAHSTSDTKIVGFPNLAPH